MTETPDIARLLWIAGAAIAAYAFILVALRLFGKRTTAQFNSFDWLINITLGSLLASGILLKDISVAASAVAIVTLIGLQFLLSFLSQRSHAVAAVVKARPTLLVQDGRMIEPALRRMRVADEEVLSAVRQSGFARLDEVGWVVLETNGSLSVIAARDYPLREADALKDIATD